LFKIRHDLVQLHGEIVPLFNWTNPNNIDLTRPYIYYIKVVSPKNEYRYIGKGSSPSRMDAYWKNVDKVLAGKPKRPAIKRDGTPQSDGNQKFRYVHLVLAVAIKNGWKIEHFPLENVEKIMHTIRESELIQEHNCDMNSQGSWWVDDFNSHAQSVQ
jgi:hypothetical protein